MMTQTTSMKNHLLKVLLVLFGLCAVVNAFFLPKHSVVSSSSPLRQSSSSFSRCNSGDIVLSTIATDNDETTASASTTSFANKDETTTTSSSSLNQGHFLSDMETSLQALLQHQQDLLNSLQPQLVDNDSSSSRCRTKQDQIDRQYEPFRKLAVQAQQLKAKYAQEIQDLQSASPPNKTPPKGLTKPTQALATLGVGLMGAAVVVVVLASGTNVQNVGGIMEMHVVGDWISHVMDKVQDTVPSTTVGEPSSSSVITQLTQTVVAPETATSSSSYVFKDFGNLDFYGSSEQVERWFANQ